MLTLAFFLVLHLQGVVTARNSSQLSTNEILKAYEAACGLISSFDLHVKIITNVELVPAGDGKWERKSRTFTALYRHRFSDGKSRVDLMKDGDAELVEGNCTVIWDRAVGRAFYAAERAGVLSSSTPQPSLRTITQTYRDFDLDYSYVQFAHDRLPQSVKSARQDKFLVVSVSEEPERQVHLNRVGAKLHLDPERGLMPARIDRTVDRAGKSVLNRTFENELLEVRPGVWVVVRSRETVYIVDPTSKWLGQVISRIDIDVDLSRSRFDVPLEKSVFEFNFPPGTTVRDELNRTTYIVGAENQASYLNELAVEGRLNVEDLQKARPPMRETTVVSQHWGKRLLLWVNLAVLGCIIALLGYRFRRRLWRPRTPVSGAS